MNSKTMTEHLKKDFTKKTGIGIKLICGVAIVSNIFILLLLYAVWYWDRQVGAKTESLLQIQKDLNMNLRESVTSLQNSMVRLPGILETDTGKRVFQWIKANKTIQAEKKQVKRSSYKTLFSRSQRRDLSKGLFIIQQEGNRIIVSKGVMTANGEFTETIRQVIISSSAPAADIVSIRASINRFISEGKSGEAMRQTLKILKSDIADKLLAAEKNRTRMLEKLELIEETEKVLNQARHQRKSIIIMIGGLTIAANVLIIFFLTRLIVLKPLRHVITSLKEIAKGEGNLTKVLPVESTDELGELGFFFNRFMKKLKAIISQLQEQMARLRESNLELSGISDALGQKAEQMHTKAKEAVVSTESTVKKIEKMASFAESANLQVRDVATLSGDVSGQIARIGDATCDVSEAVNKIAVAVDEISASLTDISQNTGRGTSVTLSATQKADHSTAMIKDLNLSAKEINDVVVLIKGIADQTHLLSFNAAIEAAGAGEAGKGFTVVANEVKELSRRTAAATTTIRNKIEAMQASTQVVIQSIVSIVSVIREAHDIMSAIALSVETQTASINEISKNIFDTSSFADEVSGTLQEAVKRENELSRKLSLVFSDTDKIARDAEEALQQTKLTRQNVTKVDTKAMATFEDTQKIEEQIRSLTRMYRRLNQIVVQFKIK